MPYRYALERPDYSPLASGQVLYSLPGHPAFPVRLASEIFQLGLAACRANGLSQALRVFDPCCGAGYLLSVLLYLHGEEIGAAYASDVDGPAVAQARRNLGLLTPAGLAQREAEIAQMLALYGKESHRAALQSAAALRPRIQALHAAHPIASHAFQASAFDCAALLRGLGAPVDLVITDLPYGQHSHWQQLEDGAEPAAALLQALLGCLSPGGVVVLASDKGAKLAHPAYQRVGQLRLGKRQVSLLRRAIQV